MKIYLASSWRNERQPFVLAALREAGHDVYDFRNPGPGDNGFGWTEIDPLWPQWSPAQFREALGSVPAERGFRYDMDALRNCEACVLLLPSGRSAAMEFGWACGAGRFTIALVESMNEPELMLKMADRICLSVGEALAALRSAPEARP